MRTPVTLVTGAGGEIGHGLITRLARAGRPIVTIDIAPLDPALAPLVRREFTGSITDTDAARARAGGVRGRSRLPPRRAAVHAREFTPLTAHEVNVEGTLNLLEFAQHEGESHGRPVTFVYPSSIAAYGLPDLDTKTARRPRARGRVEHAAHDVRLQQALLRAPGALLRAPLQAAGGACRRAAWTSAACAFRA